MDGKDRNKYLGKWSRTLGISTVDIISNRSVMSKHVTNGFIFELRYLMSGIKSDMECALKLKKMEPSLRKVNIASIGKTIHHVCEKVKKYLKSYDPHVDAYLAENFDLIRRLRIRTKCLGLAYSGRETPENEGDPSKDDVVDLTAQSHSPVPNITRRDEQPVMKLPLTSKAAEISRLRTLSTAKSSGVTSKTPKLKQKSCIRPHRSPIKTKTSLKPLSHSYQQFLVSRNRAKSRFIRSNRKTSILKNRKTVSVRNITEPQEGVPMDIAEVPVDIAEVPAETPDDIPKDLLETASDIPEMQRDIPEMSNDIPEMPSDIPEMPSDIHDMMSTAQSSDSQIAQTEIKLENLEDQTEDEREEEKHNAVTSNHWWKSECEALARYLPDVSILAKNLHAELVCGLCGGYIYNATTIAECMHTFCRKCILFHIEFNKRCPSCKALIDESNPYGNLRTDKIYQVIVDKLLPGFAKAEAEKREEFYKEKGYDGDNIPPDGATGASQKSKIIRTKQVHRWISLYLQFVGYDEKVVPAVNELECPYLRVPSSFQVRHIQQYLAKMLPLPDYFQALILFDRFLLHEDLKMSGVEVLFGTEIDEEQEDDEQILVLQYGIVPKGVDYFNSLETDRFLERELDRSAPVIEEPVPYSQPSSAAHSETEDDAPTTMPTNVSLNDAIDDSSNDSFTPGAKDKRVAKTKSVWICCLCDTEQRNIYSHLQTKHKIMGEERRIMSHKCTRLVVEIDTGNVIKTVEPGSAQE